MKILQTAEKIERKRLFLSVKEQIYRILISGLNGKFCIADHRTRFRISTRESTIEINIALSNCIIVNLGKPRDGGIYTEYRLTKKGYKLAAELFDISINV